MSSDVFGLAIQELPDGFMPIGCVLMIKGMDKEGNIRFIERATSLNMMEMLGMAESFADTARSCLMRGSRDPD